MKNIKILIGLLFIPHFMTSQITKSEIDHNENAKSGNFKDVLSSMFQLATTNLTGDNKTIEFNSTLFAIKNAANPNSTDFNYKNLFDRKLQFNFKLNLDTNYKYKGFDGGITYALVDERDKLLANFANTELHRLFNSISDEIMNNQLQVVMAKYNPIDVNSAIKKILKNEPDENFTETEKPIKSYLLGALDKNVFKTATTLKDGTIIRDSKTSIAALSKLRNEYLSDMDSKILWTLTTDGTANTAGKFNKASVGTVFLKGNKGHWNEIDVRAKFTYADTLSTGHLPRTGLNAKAGMNFKLSSKGSQVSYFEIKALGEYNKIYHNVLSNEKSESITANAEIRIRITKDLWLPLVVKYDLDNANVLGFLNVSYNFGQ